MLWNLNMKDRYTLSNKSTGFNIHIYQFYLLYIILENSS